MKITDGAKELLENDLIGNGAEGIRLYSVPGSYEPQFALSLDAPQESDTIKTINGIKVAIDSNITGTEKLTLEREENQNGVGLVLLGYWT